MRPKERKMRRTIMLTALAVLAFAASAHDGVELSMKTKALAASGGGAFFVAKQGSAPFAYARDPIPQLMDLEEHEKPVAHSVCDATLKNVCYDLTEQRVVYRGGREYMPSMQGLRAESVSLRHNRIIFKYSFR